jgi:hypothetical protein
MISSHPSAPKQPRRVTSGQRATVNHVPATGTPSGPRRVRSGDRAPVGNQPAPAPTKAVTRKSGKVPSGARQSRQA